MILYNVRMLYELLPPRMIAAAQSLRARIVDLATARQKRGGDAPRAAWSWSHWGGMAACLVAGVFAGRMVTLPGDDVTAAGGRLVARGDLARALSTQLAAQQPADAPVRLATSYLSRSGEYCRSFTLVRSGAGGVACRQGNDRTPRVMAPERPAAAAAGPRTA